MSQTRGSGGRKPAITPPPAAPGPSVATNPADLSNIDNSAADIIGGGNDANEARQNAALGAELPPIQSLDPGMEGAPDAGAATNAVLGAELPPHAQAPAVEQVPPPPAGLAEAPLSVPADVTRVGAAPLPTDNSGQPIVQDNEGTPLNKKAKYTDKSVWKEGVQAEVRAAVLKGQLVRRMTNEHGSPVYRFYH